MNGQMFFLRILKVLINSWSHYFRLFCKKRIRRFKGNWNFARTITEWKFFFLKQSLSEEVSPLFYSFFYMTDNEKYAYAVVPKILATAASMTSLLPQPYARNLQRHLSNVPIGNEQLLLLWVKRVILKRWR